MLAVVGVDIGREQALDRARKLAVESVDQNGFKDVSFKQYIGFSCRRIGGASRRGGRSSDFLLSVIGCFRGILLCGDGEGSEPWRNGIQLHFSQELRHLSRVGGRGWRILKGEIWVGRRH